MGIRRRRLVRVLGRVLGPGAWAGGVTALSLFTVWCVWRIDRARGHVARIVVVLRPSRSTCRETNHGE